MKKWGKEVNSLNEQQKTTIHYCNKSKMPLNGYSVDLMALGGMKQTYSLRRTTDIFRRSKTVVLSILFSMLLSQFPCISNANAEIASFYGLNAKKEHLNKNTASGEVFYPSHLTAASYKYYKKYVLLKSLRTGNTLWVYVNDLGPNKRLGRDFDLTPQAFLLLENDLRQGLTTVEVLKVVSL